MFVRGFSALLTPLTVLSFHGKLFGMLSLQPAREPAGKNMQKAKQNGKDSKPSTPASKTKVSEEE